jgi:hypothetical protein
MRTNRTINCKCEIYETDYRLTIHTDGSITVRVPHIAWVNNNGILKHTKYTYKPEQSKRIAAIKRFFAKDELCNDDGVTLEDVLFC